MLAAPDTWLAPDFYPRLNRIAWSWKTLAGALPGGFQLSKHAGSGPDFAGFREYAPGDDLRFMDWNACARLDRHYVKLYREEREGALYFLLDSSASMTALPWPAEDAPPTWQIARQLILALSYFGLRQLDSVYLASFAQSLSIGPGPLRGQGAMHHAHAFLSGQFPNGQQSQIDQAAISLARRSRVPGTIIIVSDALALQGLPQALKILRGAGHRTLLLVMGKPAPHDPPADSHYLLSDPETGLEMPVNMSLDLWQKFKRQLSSHRLETEKTCRSFGALHVFLDLSESLEHHLATIQEKAAAAGYLG